jgi:hypothetical protein
MTVFGDNNLPGPKIAKVKVCGINALEDLELCVSCGADALGFLVHDEKQEEAPSRSGHRLDWKTAIRLIKAVPPHVASVLRSSAGNALYPSSETTLPIGIAWARTIAATSWPRSSLLLSSGHPLNSLRRAVRSIMWNGFVRPAVSQLSRHSVSNGVHADSVASNPVRHK